jgi:hypothetical protein
MPSSRMPMRCTHHSGPSRRPNVRLTSHNSNRSWEMSAARSSLPPNKRGCKRLLARSPHKPINSATRQPCCKHWVEAAGMSQRTGTRGLDAETAPKGRQHRDARALVRATTAGRIGGRRTKRGCENSAEEASKRWANSSCIMSP